MHRGSGKAQSQPRSSPLQPGTAPRTTTRITCASILAAIAVTSCASRWIRSYPRLIFFRGMESVTYETNLTALLVIDPYNDFISEGGKLWNRVKSVAEGNQCVPHMLQVLRAARSAGL